MHKTVSFSACVAKQLQLVNNVNGGVILYVWKAMATVQLSEVFFLCELGHLSIANIRQGDKEPHWTAPLKEDEG